MTLTLSLKNRLDCISRKANSALGIIIRVSMGIFSPEALRTHNVQLVRPILDYCSPIWSSYQLGQIDLLEAEQRSLLWAIGLQFGFCYTDVPLDDLSCSLNLQSLSSRRKLFDLKLFKRIISTTIDSPDLRARIYFHEHESSRTKQLFHRRFYPTQY